MAKSLDEVLSEVANELERLGKTALGTSLPQYTSYDGLRVVESKEEPEEQRPVSREAAAA